MSRLAQPHQLVGLLVEKVKTHHLCNAETMVGPFWQKWQMSYTTENEALELSLPEMYFQNRLNRYRKPIWLRTSSYF